MQRCRFCDYINPDDSLGFCPSCGAFYDRRGPMIGARPKRQSPISMPLPNRFEELIQYWTDLARSGDGIDGDTYGSVVSSTIESIWLSVPSAGSFTRAGIRCLAEEIVDREYIMDVMTGLVGKVADCEDQRMILNLCNDYVHLMMDAFGVYTDLRIVSRMCNDAVCALGTMAEAAGCLETIDRKHPDAVVRMISGYSDFAETMFLATAQAIEETSSDELDRLADLWRARPRAHYVDSIADAAELTSKLRESGGLASRVIRMLRDGRVDRFISAYLAGSEEV